MRIVWGFTLAGVLIVLGFWPSFFSNPSHNDVLRLTHGVFATAWLVTLIAQAALIATSRTKAHHWVGRLSVIWFAGFIITAEALIPSLLSTPPTPFNIPLPVRPIIVLQNFLTVPMLVATYVAAIVFALRRQIDLHYRLMICTVFYLVIPALERPHPDLPWLPGGLVGSFLLAEACLAVLIVYDLVKHKRVDFPYPVTLAGLICVNIVMFQASNIEPFMQAIRLLGYSA